MVKNSAEQSKKDSKEKKKKKDTRQDCLRITRGPFWSFTWLQPLKILNYPCLAYLNDKWPYHLL